MASANLRGSSLLAHAKPREYRSRVSTLFLVGPTAVGKSMVAIELAKRLNAEIVSADSMLVYRGMDIGTAKPTTAERATVPHHMLDIVDITEPFDVKQYVNYFATVVSKLSAARKTVIVVGGTGLYVRALRRGLFEGPGRNPKLRAKLEVMSTETLYAELQRVDPKTAARIDRHNPRRLVRALEVFHSTGLPISELQAEWSVGQPSRLSTRTGSSTATDRRDACPTGFCLNRDRQDLYARIDRRIDEQIATGWVGEVRRLMEQGLEKNPTAMQAAGYRELVDYVRAESGRPSPTGEFADTAGRASEKPSHFESLPEVVAQIKTRTRQLARRQLTWFRREPGLIWVDVAPEEPPARTAERLIQIGKENSATR